MAVYTVLSHSRIAKIIDSYAIGSLATVSAATEGIENTNYFITTSGDGTATGGAYLLTIFEHLQTGQLAFFLDWLEQLKAHGLPVATALADGQGGRIQLVQNKPAVLFHKLPGGHPQTIEPAHCEAIGTALGELHQVSLETTASPRGPGTLEWLEQTLQDIDDMLDEKDRQLMQEGVTQGRSLMEAGLPTGLIHGDLFPDNTLFEGRELTGLVDFFSGGRGLLVYDLAVASNAWCSRRDGSLCSEKLQALLAGYRAHRPLSTAEERYWSSSLVSAATRFWLSRLADKLRPKITHHPDALVKQKDPMEYRRILSQHLNH